MNISKIIKIAPILLTDPSVFVGKKDYIFVVSHMRSFSSLFCHILGSHNEIAGYAEAHQSYHRWLDLIGLRHKVYISNNNRLDGRFILDKILHNYCYISDTILHKENVNFIFMLRDPVDTIKSIINLGESICEIEWFRDQNKVFDYYVKRLKQISDYCQKIGKKAFYFDSEILFENTESLLSHLSDRLHLGQKLLPEYKTFKHTGSPDFGDPSETIKKGIIVKTKKTYDNISIPDWMVKEAQKSYKECRKILLNQCSSCKDIRHSNK